MSIRARFERWRQRWTSARDQAPVPLVLYSRDDCPLCDEMEHALGRTRLSRPYVLRHVDIAADPELEARFGRSIPVLEIAGRVAFKGRLTEADLQSKFDRIVRESDLGAVSTR